MNTDKLQSLTQEEKEQIVKEVNTEVTSIAEEEAKSGKTIAVPGPEQLVQNCSVALMQSKRIIGQMLPTMSKKSIQRAVLAMLDLPTEGLPVYLKSDEEKALFAHGQRAIQARFIIIQHHTNKLIQEARLKKQQEQETADGSAATPVQG